MSDPSPQKTLTMTVPSNETERLVALYRYQVLGTPPEAAFDRITALAARLLNMPIAMVSLVDESRAWFKSCIGFDAQEIPREGAPCSFALLTSEPLIIPDTLNDDRFASTSLVQNHPRVRFYAGAPLINQDGFNLGTLCVVDSKPHNFLSIEQQATLIDLAAMVVDELELRLALHKIAQVEADLLETTERTSAAQRCAKAGLWDWNVRTNEVYWSPEYYTMWGIDPNIPAAYDTWLNAIVEEDRDRVNQCIQTAIAQKQPIEVEYCYLHPERGLCWFMTIGNTLYDDKNQPLRATGISLDITDRKQVEADLRQKNAILNVINESAPTPIFVKDRQGRIIYANPATLEVLGKSASEVIGARDGDLCPDLEDAIRVMANDQRIMASGQTEVVEESPDGIRTFLGMKSPYRNESGEVVGLIGIASDITDRVQLERDRERVLQQEQAAREAAETANRIKDEFLAVLSHELRSPLNPILGWTKLLQSGTLDAAKTTEALDAIERNAKLQAALIEDLLDVSRILQGKLSLNIAPVDLALTIEAAIETVSLAAASKSIEIQTALDAEVGQVMGDYSRLQQIVWNLVSNAVKFTPEGGRVEVCLTRVDYQAQITVADTGKGIKPEFLPHIFEYFRQEDGATTRQFGGLGLGLAIVRHLVELHSGKVQAHSPGEGQGTTFTVQIPLWETSKGQNSEPQKSFFPFTSTPLLGIRVLVVDDEPDMRNVITFLLEKSGAEVITVETATKALEALIQFQPDILISDIGMPDVDGYTLIRQIRGLSLEQGGQVKAIALTAYAAEIDQQQALQAGFQQHLAKPIEPEVLVRAIVKLFKSNP